MGAGITIVGISERIVWGSIVLGVINRSVIAASSLTTALVGRSYAPIAGLRMIALTTLLNCFNVNTGKDCQHRSWQRHFQNIRVLILTLAATAILRNQHMNQFHQRHDLLSVGALEELQALYTPLRLTDGFDQSFCTSRVTMAESQKAEDIMMLLVVRVSFERVRLTLKINKVRRHYTRAKQ
jgi:hypothetical protein